MQATTLGPTSGNVESVDTTSRSSILRREQSHSSPPPGFDCNALTVPIIYLALATKQSQTK